MRKKPGDKAFRVSFKFPRPGWDQRLADFNRFSNKETRSCYSCLVLQLHGPSHYLSATGFSWDAILKMTNIELELIPDPDMYIFFEKGIRGGILYSSNIESFDPKQETKHIIYLDANNLYGYEM